MADTELILKIINAVNKRNCLWNVHSSEYAKRDRLEKAWQEISDEIGKPEVFCREKWRNVRTGFLRSIQYNARSDNSNTRSDNADSHEDLPTPRRKRFYLYEEMKFLLPSTDIKGQAKKRRKLSRGTKATTSNDERSRDFGGDITATVQTYAETEDTKHYTNNDSMQKTSGNYPELLNELQLTTITPKPLTTNQAEDAPLLKTNHQSPPMLKNDEANGEQNINSNLLVGPAVATKCEIGNNTTTAEAFASPTAKRNECDDRDEQQLLAFFRGNTDDILSLPRHKQRLFKRRMLELVDDLHRPDNDVSAMHYC